MSAAKAYELLGLRSICLVLPSWVTTTRAYQPKVDMLKTSSLTLRQLQSACVETTCLNRVSQQLNRSHEDCFIRYLQSVGPIQILIYLDRLWLLLLLVLPCTQAHSMRKQKGCLLHQLAGMALLYLTQWQHPQACGTRGSFRLLCCSSFLHPLHHRKHKHTHKACHRNQRTIRATRSG